MTFIGKKSQNFKITKPGNIQKNNQMGKNKFVLIGVFLWFIILSGLRAQETTMTTGGDASGNDGTVSYSVGQLFYSTFSGTGSSVAQGVQQPFEIQVVSGIEDFPEINLAVLVYPNPAIDMLTLSIDASAIMNIQQLSYQLYDMHGKLLETKKIERLKTGISLNNLNQSNYFLRVTQNNKELKTFVITKIQ